MTYGHDSFAVRHDSFAVRHDSFIKEPLLIRHETCLVANEWVNDSLIYIMNHWRSNDLLIYTMNHYSFAMRHAFCFITRHDSSIVNHLLPDTNSSESVLCCETWLIRCETWLIRCETWLIYQWIICYETCPLVNQYFAVRHDSFAVRHDSFAVRHDSSVNESLPTRYETRPLANQRISTRHDSFINKSGAIRHAL